ncbi:MAG: class I SAM-dependent methyltransferase [Terrimicrobiaceae bacterium]
MICSSRPVSSDDVAEHYDELDRFYREIWGEHVHHGLWERGDETPEEAVLNLVTLVAKRAHIGPGTRVCDVGCGYGATARKLVHECGAVVSAVTVSPAQYRHAVSRHGASGNPGYLLCDWLENDFPSEVFDAVLSIESSEHMQDKELFFAQAHRVLRPGGRLVICAWLSAECPTALQRRLLLEPICREGRMPGMGTEWDYRNWFADAGFVLESFENVSAHVRKTWTICVWRLLVNLLRQPGYLRFLFNGRAANRIFMVTISRIWLAYALGVMRYGVFTARKPQVSESPKAA